MSEEKRTFISERDPATGRIVNGQARRASSVFDDEKAERALFAAQNGGTLGMCAHAAGTTEDAFDAWMEEHPDFGAAIRAAWRESRHGSEANNYGGLSGRHQKNLRAYDDAMGETIVQAMSLGLSISATAGLLRINHSTLGEWLNPESKLYKEDLHERVREAEGHAIAVRLQRIQARGEAGVWQADAWWLERTHPVEFALRRDRWEPPATNVTVNITNEVQDAAAAKLEAFRREQQQKMLTMEEGPNGWQLPPPKPN